MLEKGEISTTFPQVLGDLMMVVLDRAIVIAKYSNLSSNKVSLEIKYYEKRKVQK